MKAHISLLSVSLLLFIVSCKQPKAPEPTPTNTTGNVTIRVNNQVNGINLIQDSMMFTNTSGNPYSVHLLKYYISNVVLKQANGTEFKLNNYDLIDAFDTDFSTIVGLNIPNGTYTSMSLMLGIDSLHNHTGAQDGDLDIANNMFWSWNTGYIFFKHEGYYKDLSNTPQSLLFHLGKDKALSTVNIPISITVAGSNKTMNIVFDLNNMYNSPAIDFNMHNNHMSIVAGDDLWITKMTANSVDAFTFKNVE